MQIDKNQGVCLGHCGGEDVCGGMRGIQHRCQEHTQFWNYVTDLEKHGFIKTSTHKTDDGPGSSAIHISLQDIPSKVLANKIEAMLEMF